MTACPEGTVGNEMLFVPQIITYDEGRLHLLGLFKGKCHGDFRILVLNLHLYNLPVRVSSSLPMGQNQVISKQRMSCNV